MPKSVSNSPLIVAGMHRSGTSLLTSILSQSGLAIGSNLLKGDRGNPDGHYEDLDFLSLHMDILRSQGFNIEGFLTEQVIKIPTSIIPRVQKIIKQKQSITQEEKFWGWKEPRTTLFLKFWKQQLPDAKVLAVYRAPWDVADSLYRRGDPCFEYNPRSAIEVWNNYNSKIIDFYNDYPEDTIIVSIESALKCYDSLIDLLRKKLNVNLNRADIGKIYKPDLFLKNSTNSPYHKIVCSHCPQSIDIYQRLIEIDSFSKTSNNLSLLPMRDFLNEDYHGDLLFQQWHDLRKLEGEKQRIENQLQEQMQIQTQSYQSEISLQREKFNKSLHERDELLNNLKLQIQNLNLQIQASQNQSKILTSLKEIYDGFEILQTHQQHLQSGQLELQTHQQHLQSGQLELQTHQQHLQSGQLELQTHQQHLQSGQLELQAHQQNLQSGQASLATNYRSSDPENLLDINFVIKNFWVHSKRRISFFTNKAIKIFLLFQKVFWWIVTLQFGKKMARRRIARLISNSGLFDTGYYWTQTGNDPIAQSDPLGHYLDIGAKKFLNPHPLFDTQFYLESYPDLVKENINPLAHYLLVGAKKGYNPHPLFDTQFYLTEYPDILNAGVNPLWHYSQIGVNENRDPFKCSKISIDFPYISREFANTLEEIPKSQSPEYQKWLEQHYPSIHDFAKMKIQADKFEYQPLISIIMPTFNTDEKYLREAIESVINQVYVKWELCIADDCSTDSYTKEILNEYREQDERIKIVFREENGHISAASNSALSLATGEFVALLDHDDLLTPHALYRVVELLNDRNDVDMIYSDEDKINEDGFLSDAAFKPDWSPDSFLSRNYTCHLGVYRRSIIEEIQGFRIGYEGAQDYDLVLRFTEKTDKIYHIPDILYHWRIHPASTAGSLNSKTYATFAAKKAIADALKRRGEPGTVTDAPFYPGYHIVRYDIPSKDLVSVIIPTRNMGSTLETCLKSVFELSTYPNFEVIVVDNGSTENLVKRVFDKWSLRQPDNFKVLPLDIPFNFSKINNYAVEHSQGKYLLFLNNDTEVITPDWIECMVEQAQRPSIGAVGNMLLYPDDTIQHAGVINGIVYCCSHTHKGFRFGDPGYLNYLNTVNNYSAVTGASLMCCRSVFDEIEGFNETLAVNFNDIDLCLRMIKKGYRNIWLPHARLYHYESKSRGYDMVNQNKKARLYCEAKYFKNRWKSIIEHDPCYNPNLTISHEDFRIRW